MNGREPDAAVSWKWVRRDGVLAKCGPPHICSKRRKNGIREDTRHQTMIREGGWCCVIIIQRIKIMREATKLLVEGRGGCVYENGNRLVQHGRQSASNKLALGNQKSMGH